MRHSDGNRTESSTTNFEVTQLNAYLNQEILTIKVVKRVWNEKPWRSLSHMQKDLTYCNVTVMFTVHAKQTLAKFV